ncbi:MAG: ABC transporter permease [Candidatus Bipolaricaulota bacterium]|nr:ABC transporter permease [Candidatus Bipolaricaulota bacterium]
MITYIFRRTLYMLPLLILVSLISFVLIQVMPGDYLTRAQMNPQITQETLNQMKARYGLDKPFIVQYWLWFKQIITKGDFGTSFETMRPVYWTLFMGDRLMWTLIIASSTMLLTWLIAIPLGIYSATHQYKPSDHALTFFGFLGLSIPNFFFALVVLWVLVAIFKVGNYGLGVGGLFDNRFIGAPWSLAKLANLLWHIWPAWLVIGTSGMAGLLRYMRGSLLDTLSLQYVQTARAKGLAEYVVVYKHAVRNAINPLVSMLGMSLPGLVSGSLVTAIVLNLPTVERAFWSALQRQDTYVIMGGLLFFSLFLLIGNLLADILLAWVDPRIRYG